MKQNASLVGSSPAGDALGARPVQTVITLLDTLGRSLEPMTLTEITRASGVPKATAYRYLLTLLQHGYVARSARAATYCLGSGVLDLSRAYYLQFQGLDPAREALPALAMETGETAHIGVLSSEKVVYIDIAESDQRVRAYVSRGEQLPAYCVAAGHAILAHSPERVLETVMAAGMPTRTANTIADRPTMQTRLQQVREQGYAITVGEWMEDVIGVSAPVFNAAGQPVAAIGVSCPLSRSTAERIDLTSRIVSTYAQRISRAHGYTQGETNV